MSYIVLARKWRPQHFDEVVGQEHVARTLCNAIDQDRVAHAFLFCGPRGIGKTSTARILAKALNCHEGPTGKPCYKCPSCLEVSRGSAVDVFEIDGASNRGVNEIRELREGVRYAPNRDRYKIYIIDEVHMLTTEAFNALLKTLEEPPPHVKFIFATTEPQKIPVTILSRCQRFDFKRIPIRKITARLELILKAEKVEAQPGALSIIARQADGGMRDALSLTDQVISFADGKLSEDVVAEILGVASRELLFRLTQALVDHKIETALKILDDVSQGGQDLLQFAAAVVSHLRDLTVVKVTGKADQMTDLTQGEFNTAQHQTEAISADILHRMFNLMVEAAGEMSRSAFPKLIFEMALVKLADIEPLIPVDVLIKRLAALEEGLLIGAEDPRSGAGQGGGSGAAQAQRRSPADPSQPSASPEPPAREAAAASPEPPVATVPAAASPEPPVTDPEPPVTSASPEPPVTSASPEPPVAAPMAASPEPPVASPEPPVASPEPPVQAATEPPTDSNEPKRLPRLNEISWELARSSWREVVKELSDTSTISSAWLMQAHLKQLSAGKISLRFNTDLAEIMDAKKHAPLVAGAANNVLTELWNGGWEIDIQVLNDSEGHPQNRSLAEEDAEIIKARRDRAKEIISNHQNIADAQEIFGPMKVNIVLEDEEFYTWDLI